MQFGTFLLVLDAEEMIESGRREAETGSRFINWIGPYFSVRARRYRYAVKPFADPDDHVSTWRGDRDVLEHVISALLKGLEHVVPPIFQSA
jgi:hypothetical protein